MTVMEHLLLYKVVCLLLQISERNGLCEVAFCPKGSQASQSTVIYIFVTGRKGRHRRHPCWALYLGLALRTSQFKVACVPGIGRDCVQYWAGLPEEPGLLEIGRAPQPHPVLTHSLGGLSFSAVDGLPRPKPRGQSRQLLLPFLVFGS
jgi:hypothetical protein